MVFATLWAVLLWGEGPGPVEAVSHALVLAAGVVVALPGAAVPGAPGDPGD